MLGLEKDRFERWDGVLLCLFATLGALLGWLVVLRVGSVFFYQMFTPEALMWACGHGFRYPLTLSPQMIDFLLDRKIASFDCASILPNAPAGPPGFFIRAQIWLAWPVAILWRILGPTQTAMAPLAAFLAASYAAGAFVLARVFLGRTLAVLATLVISLSPVAVGMIFLLRDFSKAPFFLWGLALLVLAARSLPQRRYLFLAAAAGATAGLGYGFRADLGILLPLGLLFLALASRAGLLLRGEGLLAYGLAYLLLAAPILTVSNTGNSGLLVMQGATEPFRAFLGLRPAPYALGTKYSDELTLSAIAAAERPRHPDWDTREPNPIYGVSQTFTYSLAYLFEWAPNFAADFAAQSLKSAAWLLGYPALVAVTRGNPDPGFPLRLDIELTRWQEPVYSLFAQPWMPLVGLLGMLAWLLRVSNRSYREAVGLAVLLSALLTYPAVQFSVRHVFHLEFLWVISVLSLPVALWEYRRLLPDLGRFTFVAGGSLAAVAVVYLGLVQVQQKRLTSAFRALLTGPQRMQAFERTPQADGSVLLRVPVPSEQMALVNGAPDSMTNPVRAIENDVRAGAERMELILSGPLCPETPFTIEIRYDHRPNVWQPLDTVMTARPGDAVIFPAFYRATQNFAGILLPSTHAGCSVQLARLPLTNGLPAMLSAVLPPSWESLPLRKGLGRFGLGAAH
jgi:hypothetical protein